MVVGSLARLISFPVGLEMAMGWVEARGLLHFSALIPKIHSTPWPKTFNGEDFIPMSIPTKDSIFTRNQWGSTVEYKYYDIQT